MKIKGDDFKEVIQYIQNKTHGGDLSVEVTPEGNLQIKTEDKYGSPVTIIVYAYTSEYPPRLIKTGRLNDDL